MKHYSFGQLARSLKAKDLAVIRLLREGGEITLSTPRKRYPFELLSVRPHDPLITKEAVNFLEGAGLITHRSSVPETCFFFLTQHGHAIATMMGYKERP